MTDRRKKMMTIVDWLVIGILIYSVIISILIFKFTKLQKSFVGLWDLFKHQNKLIDIQDEQIKLQNKKIDILNNRIEYLHGEYIKFLNKQIEFFQGKETEE